MKPAKLALAAAVALFGVGVASANSFGPSRGTTAPVASPRVSGAPMQRAAATITQSSSFAITPGGTISCNSGQPAFLHTEISYYRAFTLSTFPQLDDVEFRVDSVQVGIETANDAAGAGQPLSVRLHRSATNPPTLASLTLLASEDITVPDSASGTLLNVNFSSPQALVVASDILVVEVFQPEGQTAGHSLFVGSNAGGQTGPTYIRAPGCSVDAITDLASIGFGTVHLVMSVSGNTQVPVTLQNFDVE